MTEDFRERLEARKAELRAEKIPEPILPTPSYVLQAELFWDKIGQAIGSFIIYAAVFIAVACGAVVKDWWSFIGSREYHEYKLRTGK